jgi:hypothetical protein
MSRELFAEPSNKYRFRRFENAISRLIGHRLRVRLYDDRLECFLGATPLITFIHSLRRKPMGLLNLVYREQLFPRRSYQRAFEALLAGDSEKQRAARSSDCWRSLMIGPAKPSSLGLSMPSSDTLGRRFAPHPTAIPDITVKAAPLHLYEVTCRRASASMASAPRTSSLCSGLRDASDLQGVGRGPGTPARSTKSAPQRAGQSGRRVHRTRLIAPAGPSRPCCRR